MNRGGGGKQAQRQHKPRETQRCGYVITEEFRVAENVSGLGIVIGIPADQRCQGDQQGNSPPHRCRRLRPPGATVQRPLQKVPSRQRRRCQDRSLLRQRRQGKPNSHRHRPIFQVRRQSPECKSRGSQIDLRQRTLRKKNRIQRGAHCGRDRNLRIGRPFCQAESAGQGERRNHQHGRARHNWRVADAVPPECQPGKDQRRVRIRYR